MLFTFITIIYLNLFITKLAMSNNLCSFIKISKFSLKLLTWVWPWDHLPQTDTVLNYIRNILSKKNWQQGVCLCLCFVLCLVHIWTLIAFPWSQNHTFLSLSCGTLLHSVIVALGLPYPRKLLQDHCRLQQLSADLELRLTESLINPKHQHLYLCSGLLVQLNASTASICIKKSQMHLHHKYVRENKFSDDLAEVHNLKPWYNLNKWVI